MAAKLKQKWYRDRFGIHDHKDWDLNMAHRAHAFCKKVWVENE